MICLVSLTSRPQKGLAFWKRQSTSDFSLLRGVFGVLPFLFGQVRGEIHCPTWARDLSPESLKIWVSERLPLLKKADRFCLFYLAKSRAKSTARVGCETWVRELRVGCEKRYRSCLWTSRVHLSKKAEHFRLSLEKSLVFCLFYLAEFMKMSAKRQSTSDFSFWGVFGVLPFLFGLFVWRHVVEKPSKSPLLMPTAISRWIHQFSSDHWS